MRRLKTLLRRSTVVCAVAICGATTAQTFDKTDCFEVEAIDRVWSGHRVAFDYVGKGDRQIVAYYDASRQMSVAYKTYPTGNWIFQKLDSYLGWDSHNSVVIGLDEEGFIHIVGIPQLFQVNFVPAIFRKYSILKLNIHDPIQRHLSRVNHYEIVKL